MASLLASTSNGKNGWLDDLLDKNSFTETGTGRLANLDREIHGPGSDHLLTGWGSVHGRRVSLFAHRSNELRDAFGETANQQRKATVERAVRAGTPVIGIYDGLGIRVEDGLAALAEYGEALDSSVAASGVVPQISAVLGPSVGGAAFAPGLSDFVFTVRDESFMFMTAPSTIETITGEAVDLDELGGAMTLASRSGVAHVVAADDEDCLAQIRYLMSFLPGNNLETPPYYPPSDDRQRRCERLKDLLPDSANVPYDMRNVISEIFDDGEFFELHEHWARNILVGFARLDGHVVGVVANQPMELAGTLDINTSIKGARFVRFCDSFNIPLLVLVDTPGFLPGIEQEYGGIIRYGAQLLYAFTEATVPRITVITRKAYGGAYLVMNSKHIRADLSFSWPTGEIAVMGSDGATRIIHKREIAAAEDPDLRAAELRDDYSERFSNPYRAAERGYIDDVINPEDTRKILVASFEMLRDKREAMPPRKHGNITL